MMLWGLALAVLAAQRDTEPPYLAFPEPGLDDPAAYQGYETRVYRDAQRNAFQVYLQRRTGRVVHLWADAANESVGFTARDSTGRPAALAWASSGAVVGQAGAVRSVGYALEAASPLAVGLFLLGSMRVERDFQYAGRDSLPFDSTPYPQAELLALAANLQRLGEGERARHLALLRAGSVAELRARLVPRIAVTTNDTGWVARLDQTGLDGRGHLSLMVTGDARQTVVARAGPTSAAGAEGEGEGEGEGEDAAAGGIALTIRSRSGGPVRFTVWVTTDAPALTPLSRDEIFNDEFRGFYETVRADAARPERFRRLEREVRGIELLSYREKLMAGLPNFATYFGRDMLVTALLMQPVWSAAMPEHVLASALRKLSPDGEVSHEEALGGQAIRENAAEYNRRLAEYRRHAARGERTAARRALARARTALRDLQRVRENYVMVDDDFQLPVVAARYLADPRVPARQKRRFLLEERRLARLVSNLAYVARRAAPYARAPVATNLVSFPRGPDGRWISASWRDSRAGYAGGRFAMDVNVVWVPRALEGLGAILDALEQAGFTAAALDSLAPAIREPALTAFVRDRAALDRAVATWRGAEAHFQVGLPPGAVAQRVAARLRRLRPPERDYWDSVVRQVGLPTDTLRFLALSLDGAGRPIPIVHTDAAMLLLLDSLAADRARALVDPITRPYPVGLLVADLGPVVANDAYASPDVWDGFRRDAYHSPTVVWGREVNVLLVGLARQIRAAGSDSGAASVELKDALRRLSESVDRSGLRHAELWSYRIDDGRLLPSRYGTGSDVQLWSLTDLAVQYLLNHPTP